MTPFLHPFISLDNILNEGMSDHILVREVNKFDSFDSFENALDFDQPRNLIFRKVHLGDIPCDDGLGTETQSRQKHLHLLRSCILCLVEDDEGIVEGSSPHEG